MTSNENSNVLIVGFYHLQEHLNDMAMALEDHFYFVEFFPLFQLMHDEHDWREDYMNKLVQKIETCQPTAIFWQCLCLDLS